MRSRDSNPQGMPVHIFNEHLTHPPVLVGGWLSDLHCLCLVLLIQGSQVFQLDAGAVQVASETRTYNLVPGVSQVGGSATASPVIALPPDVYLTDLSQFTTNTLALDVGDNFSTLVLFVEDCGAQPS